ncbi:twitchin-like [Tubulanus polymorphus]|uniref:twitchin-like n=1 Tax=Tubulanus polymorphus TaxID=672921 RepID=UPI003DA269BE
MPRKININKEPGKCTLVILNASPQDVADYIITVTNEYGKDSLTIKVGLEKPPEELKKDEPKKDEPKKDEPTEEKVVLKTPTGKAPEFVLKIKTKNVQEGENADFNCEVVGEPKPSINWQYNGKSLKEGGHYTMQEENNLHKLEIYDIVPTDAGKYSAVAKNDHGKAICSADLKVKAKPKPKMEPPKIVKKPTKEVVNEGDRTQFLCRVTGSPRPTVTWTKRGKKLTDEKLYHIEDYEETYVFEIINSKISDSDVYLCKAKNEAGEDKCSIKLDVKPVKKEPPKSPQILRHKEETQPPKFTETLKDTTLKEGSGLTLKAKVTGVPRPDVEWMKKSLPIKPSDNISMTYEEDTCSLTIAKTTTKDTAEYVCKATNPVGEDTCTARVLVEAKPKEVQPPEVEEDYKEEPEFTKPLKNDEVKEGRTLRVDCRGTGVPIPEFTWFKNDEPLAIDNKRVKVDRKYNKRDDETALILTVETITMDDAGTYKCIAKNSEGQADTVSVVTVEAKKIRPDFIKKPDNYEIYEKDSVTFEVEVSGFPHPTVTWNFSDKELKPSDQVIITEDFPKYSLTLKDCVVNQTGVYNCRLTNEAGGQFANGRLKVRPAKPPKFVKKTEDVVSPEHGTAKFTCKVAGVPSPTLTWFINDKQIEMSESITSDYDKKTDLHTLTFIDTMPDIGGKLKCLAKNNAGEASCEAILTVRGRAPIFIDKPIKCTVLADLTDDSDSTPGQTGLFQTRVDGEPKPKVEWTKGKWTKLQAKKDKYKIHYDETKDMHILEIENVKAGDAGTYVCTISNEHGSDNVSVTLIVTQDETLVTDWKASLQHIERAEKPIEEEDVDFGVSLRRVSEVQAPEEIKEDKITLTHLEMDESKPTPYERTEVEHVEMEFKPMDFGEKHERSPIDEGEMIKPIKEKDVEAEPDDKDKYQREPKKKEEGEVTAPKLVIPKVKWVFEKEIEDVSTMEKTSADYECEVTIKDFKVKWTVNDVEVVPGPKYQVKMDGKKHTLSVNMCEITDNNAVIKCQFGKAETKAKLFVTPRERKFIRPLSDVTVEESETATFECEFSLDDVPATWYIAGKSIKEDDRFKLEQDSCIHRLIISNCVSKDAGPVAVKFEKFDSTANLTVKGKKVKEEPAVEKPRFLGPLKDQRCKENETVTFKCETSKPDVQITWLKGDQELKPSDRIVMKTEGTEHTLTIPKTLLSDDSSYSATIENDKTTAKLEVEGKFSPQVVAFCVWLCYFVYALLLMIRNKYGSKVFHSVSYLMRNSLCGLYPKKKAPIALQFRYESHLQSTDRKFTKPLTGKKCSEGDTITLECQVSVDNADVSWFVNGKTITPNDKYEIVTDGKTRKLIIHNAQLDDETDYTAKLEDKAETTAPLTVKEIPVAIKAPLKDKACLTRDSVTLECELTKPDAQVKWMKNGKEIKPEDGYKIEVDGCKHRLIIPNAKQDDEADFTLSVEKLSTKANLTVSEFDVSNPDEIVVPLSEKFVKEDEYVEFTAELIKPNLPVKWTKSGVEVKPSDHVKITSDGTKYKLSIPKAHLDDEAMFALVLPSGRKTDAKLHVEELPAEIIRGLEDKVIREKDTVTFECEVSKLKVNTHWYKDDRDLIHDDKYEMSSDGQVHRLTIKSANRYDAGDFTIVVEGTLKSTGNLKVECVPDAPESPEISDIFKDSCTVNWQPPNFDGGCPIIGYNIERRVVGNPRWLKVNKELIPELSLNITDLSEGLEYEFRICAENKVGCGDWSKPSKPVTAKDPWSLPGRPGIPQYSRITDDSIDLKWTPPEDDGGAQIINYVIEYRDTKSTEWITANPNKLVPELEFTVTNLKTDHLYEFRIRAQNKVGIGEPSKNTEEVRIKKPLVGEPPQLITPLEDKIVVMPKEAVFECHFTPGNPTSDIRWFKDEQPLAASDHHLMLWKPDKELASLTIKNLQPSDNGKYSCEARNIIGYAETSATLTVHAHPTLTYEDKLKEMQLLKVSQMLSLKVDVDGIPMPTVEWFFNDKPVETSQRFVIDTKQKVSVLSVKNVTREDTGKYKAVATNVVGSVAGEFEAKIRDKPSPPIDLKTTDIQKESISVIWQQPKDDGGAEITHYILERRDVKRDTWITVAKVEASVLSYKIEKLIEGNEYDVRVSAENIVGQSLPTNLPQTVTCKSPYDVPGPPRNLHPTDVTKTQCTLNWEPPESDGGLPITGYIVERKQVGSNRWVRVNKEPTMDLSMTVTDVQESQEYEFRVSAQNDEGVGKPSDVTAAIKIKDPYDVPGQPGKPVVEDLTATTCMLKWSSPTDDGGSPIINYIVEMKKPKDKSWTTISTGVTVPFCEYNVHGLTQEIDYIFRVTAENKAGQGKPSEPSDIAKYVEPLKLLRPLQDQKVNELPNTATFECELSKAGLDVKWFKNGKPISPGDKYKMVSDKGVYRLIVNDITADDDADFSIKVGDIESNAALLVEVPPKILLDMEKFKDTLVMKTGTSTVVEIPFSAAPMPKIIWSFNDGQFPDAKRIREETIPGMTALTLGKVVRTDAGEYTLVIENEFGSSTLTITLIVLDKPSPPRNLVIDDITPQSAHLKWEEPEWNGGCDITGYVIEKRDVSRASWVKCATVPELEYTALKLVEGNEYVFRVMAENECGLSEPVEIAQPIVAKHQFDKPGPPEAPEVSEIFKTSCLVTWKPPEKDGGSPVTGYHLEKRVTSSSRWVKVNTERLPELSLNITDLKESSEYEFRVSAENKAGIGEPSPPSKPFTAKDPWDKPGPPGIPKYSEVTDTTIKLNWTPPENDGGAPIINYVIEYKLKDGKTWKQANIDVTVVETTYTVTGLKTDSEYVFRVSAENKVGRGPPAENSEPVKIKAPLVGEPPKILKGLVDVTAVSPNEAKLTCDVFRGKPEADIVWLKNGNQVTAGDKYQMSIQDKTATLTVLKTEPKDSTSYKCEVSNLLGSCDTSSTLSINTHPLIEYDDKYKSTQTLKAGTSLSVIVKITGIPKPVVTWTLGDIIVNSDRVVSKDNFSTLSLKAVSRQDAGKYVVTAENIVGTAMAEFDVVVKDKPSPPQNLSVADIQKDSITINWQKPADDGGSPITGYIIMKRDAKKTTWSNAGKVNADTFTLQVPKLIEGNEYFFRVIAVNDIGESEPADTTEPVKAKSPFDLPGPPTNLKVTDASKKHISIEWNVPLTDGGTPIIGYLVEYKAVSSTRWIKLNKDPQPELSLNVTDVVENQEYEFRVSAQNAEGIGPPSDVLEPVKAKDPYDVPGAPGKPNMSNMTSSSGNLSWAVPDDDGGAPITNYVVEMKQPKSKEWTCISLNANVPNPEFMAQNLTEETDYIFRVYAENKAGRGPPSEPSDVARFEPLITLIRPLEDQTIKSLPASATFECEISRPGLDVQWFRDGKLIKPGDKYKIVSDGTIYRLTINDIQEEDDADYSLKFKSIETSGGLFIEVPPAFLLETAFETIIMKVNTSKITEVPFAACPMPKVTWSFNDGQLVPDRMKVETIYGMTALTLNRILRSDAGDYRCKIENKFGSQELHLQVKVIDKPSPVRNLSLINITPESADIKWDYPEDDGDSPVTGYIVEKRDKKKASYTKVETIQKLESTIPKLIANGEYVFQVTAENEVGQSKPVEIGPFVAKYRFDVPGPPDAPDVSEIFKTSCVVTWKPPLNDGGSPVTGYHLERRLTSTNRWVKINKEPIPELSLNITDLKESSEYEFRVSAENKAGVGEPSPPSKPFTAKDPWDKPGPPGIPKCSEITDTSIKLSWTPPENDGGAPILNYVIEYKLKDGKTWKQANVDVTVAETTYTVKGLKTDSEYVFRVSAENKVGRGPPAMNSEPVNIKAPLVGEPPKVIDGVHDIKIVSPKESLLQCELFRGKPEGDIVWYKAGKQITSSDKYVMLFEDSIASLKIKNTEPKDTASYKVEVSNPLGSCNSSGQLTVHVHPAIMFDKKYEDVQNIKGGSSLTIITKVTGLPQPTVYWSFADKKLSKTDRVTIESKETLSSITVKGLTRSDAGKYIITAENEVGKSTAEFTVVVKDKPSPPQNLRVTDIQKESITIEWQPPADDGGAQITGYNIMKRDAKKTTWSNAGRVKADELKFQVPKLIEGNEYFFRVVAVNEIGESEPTDTTEPAMAKSPFDVPGPPKNLHVTDASKKHIAIAWDVPDSDGGSPIIGYMIEYQQVSKKWVKLNREPIPELFMDVTDVVEKQEYEFRVSAQNSEGVGPPCKTLGPIKAKDPFDVPGPPGKPVVDSMTFNSANLHWEAPSQDGGATITNYVVEMKKPKDYQWTNISTDITVPWPEFIATNLTAETDYIFRTYAENKAGRGPPSDPSDVSRFEPPLQLIKPLSDKTVKEIPCTVKFECEISKAGLEVQWFKNDKPIKPNNKYKIENVGTTYRLIINDISDEDDADYSIKIKEIESKAALFVEVPPKFLLAKNFEDRIVMKAGTSKIIEIPFSAAPMPTVTWSYNDSQLIDERMKVETIRGMTALTLNRVIRSDVGDFTCKIENRFGSIDMNVHVTVIDKPEPVENLTLVDITPNTAEIKWDIPQDDGGTPITGYIVERREAEKSTYTKVGTTKDLEYTITKLIPDKKYVFQVTAENEVGLSKPVELSGPVVAKHQFEKPGPPNAPEVSEIFKTSCVVTWRPPTEDGGSPVTGYHLERRLTSSSRWIKLNKEPIPELSLNVTDLVESNDYEFRVSAENKAGIGEPSPPSKPFTAKDPWDKPGAPGKPVYSDIKDKSIKLTWTPPENDGGAPIINYVIEYRLKDGKSWKQANVDVTVIETTYTVTGLKTDSEYVFRVSAENKVGRGPPAENSEPVKIKAPLVGEAPKMTSKLADKIVLSPEEAVFDCKMTTGKPESEIKWYKDGKQLTPSEKYIAQYDGKDAVLKIQKTEPKDAGKYKCEASNIISSVESSASLSVFVKPNIEYEKKFEGTQSLKAGATFTVIVKVSGLPEPSVSWLFNDKSLKTSGDVKIDTKKDISTITVKNVNKSSAGRYVVTAENKVGKAAAEFNLVVRDVPSPPRDLAVTDVQKESVTLTWEVPEDDGGLPITQYVIEKRDVKKTTWSSAGKVNANTLTLHIQKLIEGNEYYFRVIAENEIGQSQPTELKEPVKAKSPFDKPGPPINLRATDISKSMITLTWEPPKSDGGSPIIGYIMERRQAKSNRWIRLNKEPHLELTMDISDVVENQEYEFRVAAQNAEGIGEPTSILGPIKAKDPWDVPGKPGKPVVNMTDTNAQLTWKPPTEDGGSPITNYFIEMKLPTEYKWTAVNADFVIPYPEHEVSGTKVETDYVFRVTAENKAGRGPPSEPSDVARYSK